MIPRLARSLALVAPAKPVAGTVPLHSAYILLHSRTPITALPPKPSSALQRALMLSIPGAIVNFAWYPSGELHPSPAVESSESEAYAITAFGDSGVLSLPNVSERNMGTVAGRLRSFVAGSADSVKPVDEETHILVCTHGSRDCRCGDRGGEVVRALREARASRLADATKNGEEGVRQRWERVKIGEVAHVGGHAHAANALVYPRGDWMGLVTAQDAPALLDSIFHDCSLVAGVGEAKWRGRRGFDKEAQLKMYEQALSSSAS